MLKRNYETSLFEKMKRKRKHIASSFSSIHKRNTRWPKHFREENIKYIRNIKYEIGSANAKAKM